MKRFKECFIQCFPNQRIEELVQLVINESRNNGYEVNRTSTLNYNDTLLFSSHFMGCPFVVILSIIPEDNVVKITNIVPAHYSGLSSFNYDQYNDILDYFVQNVFQSLSHRYHNHLEVSSDTYDICDILPLSYPLLDRWLNAYPLSGHSYDEKRWFDFLIALINNNESISPDLLSQYIEERYGWEKHKLDALEERFAEQLRLLEYYVTRR